MKLSRSTRLAAALAAGSLALAACGGSDSEGGANAAEDAGLSGTLAGAGSSAQAAAMEGWIAGFQTANEEATVNYDPVGSGGGREQFVSKGVDFAGSDSAFADADKPAEPILYFPILLGPITVPYNLDGVDELQLSPDTIAKIFQRQVTKWDDAAIAAPPSPPMRACDEEDGRPYHHVSMFQAIAPMSPAAQMVRPTVPAGASMMPLPTVLATLVPRKAPKRFAMAAMPRAIRGVSARVDTEVAIALAASWKPLV